MKNWYIYEALPRDYLKKFVLDGQETFTTLYTKINDNFTKVSSKIGEIYYSNGNWLY